MTAAREVVAVVKLAEVARDPESRVPSDSLRVALDHMSLTNVPNELNVLEALVQTEVAIVLEATVTAPTVKVLSILTKSPPISVPQLIVVGQVPSGPIDGIE